MLEWITGIHSGGINVIIGLLGVRWDYRQWWRLRRCDGDVLSMVIGLALFFSLGMLITRDLGHDLDWKNWAQAHQWVSYASRLRCLFVWYCTGSAFIKRDQLDPWIKDQLRNALLSTVLSLQLPNFVSCGRACPSHMTQNLVTVGTKLLIGECFLFNPWSMDQADLVW